MTPLFAIADYIGGLLCGVAFFWPLWLLLFSVVLYVVRCWNARSTNKCPGCGTATHGLDVRNECWKCLCEYDKWGNILKDAPLLQLNDLDLARFTTPGNTGAHRESSAEFKTGGEVLK